MKHLKSITVACVFSFMSFSVLGTPTELNHESDWMTILSSDELRVDQRSINIDGKFISIFELCIADNKHIRSINKVNQYKWNEHSRNSNPELIGKYIASTQLLQNKVYSDYDQTIERQEKLQTHYLIKVFDSSELNNLGLPRFEKTYDIPECRTTTALAE